MEPLKILIVEDQLITATDIQATIESAGHTVTAIARNTQEAIAAVKKEPPHVALIAIRLDGITGDGIDAARNLLIYHSMPIIYLTDTSEPTYFQQAKETMPAAYLFKPFRHHELMLQIELAHYNHRSQNRQTDKLLVSETLYLPINKGYKKITKKDVIYLQAEGAYVKIFMMNEAPPLLLTMNLGYVAHYFQASNFYRLSRSLMINLDHLDRIEGNQLFMLDLKNSFTIPEGNRSEFLKRLVIVRTR
ncbi:hypothetical protein GCM10027347_53970 [Larkinella harenae]